MTFGYYYHWRGTHIKVSGFHSQEEARASFRRALDLIGYRPPSWWQFWRWGEALPSPYSG